MQLKFLLLGCGLLSAAASEALDSAPRRPFAVRSTLTSSSHSLAQSFKKHPGKVSARELFGRQEYYCPGGENLCPDGVHCCDAGSECQVNLGQCCPEGAETCGDTMCVEAGAVCCAGSPGWACPAGSSCSSQEGYCIPGGSTPVKTTTPAPKPTVKPRNCGGVTHSAQSIQNAVDEANRLMQAGQQTGRNNYPHDFENRPGFDFEGPSPWQEFPILESGDVYSTQPPGPDRIVLNANGEYVGTMTHTGAEGSGFKLCTEAGGAKVKRADPLPTSSLPGNDGGSAATSPASAGQATGSAASGASSSAAAPSSSSSAAAGRLEGVGMSPLALLLLAAVDFFVF